MRMKFTWFVAVITGLTLALQVIILFKNECHFTNRRYVAVNNISYWRTKPLDRETTPTAVKDDVHPLVSVRRRLTIGIPTVKRRDGSYFLDMLSSMFNKTSDADLKQIVFVIFLADIENKDWKDTIEASLRSKYANYLQSGSLKIVQAPPSFYNKMMVTNSSYLNWRTKQNYDYAYMMKYSEPFSDYYMQMEDDVLASSDYYQAIDEFIKKQENDNWICLEFSELGFIGKLYHAKHVVPLADMLLIFSETQPVDFTFLYFNMLMAQGPRIIRKPTLFQHQGYHSSLAEKVQPLVDKFFEFPQKEYNGDNPPAKIMTSLPMTDDFPPFLPYSKEPGHFWSNGAAKAGDNFSVMFDEPHGLRGIIIETGSKSHSGDIVHNGVLEVSPTAIVKDDISQCDGYIELVGFENGKVNITQPDVEKKIGQVKMRCIRIRFTQAQHEWVIIKEIAVFVYS